MTRPRLLDLFCGAGGASVGYHCAGFEVVGVDIRPQKRYPFEFHQADALSILRGMVDYPSFNGEMWRPDYWAAIHASPPCQAYTSARSLPNTKDDHPDLVGPVRDLLRATRLPWVIENVPGAPLSAHVMLCGSMFGLAHGEWELRRHRLFELNGFFCLTPPCQHNGPVLGIYGEHARDRRRVMTVAGDHFESRRRTMSIAGNFQARETRRVLGVYGNGTATRARGTGANIEQARALMGIDWMTGAELCQAIPPAYTEHIGLALMEAIDRERSRT